MLNVSSRQRERPVFRTRFALIIEQDDLYLCGKLCQLYTILGGVFSCSEESVPGDSRVAFSFCQTSFEIVLCYYAFASKIGAIAVPLNIRFQAELLQYAPHPQRDTFAHQ